MGITVYTDGACTSSGVHKGIGGWAYSILADRASMENAGGVIDTTNNRMEIEAVIRAITQINETTHLYSQGSEIVIHTDSELIVNTMHGLYKQKKNHDKWLELEKAIQKVGSLGHSVKFAWVKSHDSSAENNNVDKLARQARDSIKQELLFLKTLGH